MKQYIARILTCALVLGTLSTAALAAEMTVPSGTGTVTLSDVVATETKTMTINGNRKEVTIHYVSLDSTFQATPPTTSNPDVDYGSTYYYQGMNDTYEMRNGGAMDYNKVLTFDAETFEADETGLSILFAIEADWDAEVFCMLDGQQGAGAVAATNGATTPAAPATTTGGTTYTVVKYDTMGQIALNNYGSYKYHTALYKANAEVFEATGGALKPGMALTLPDTEKVGNPPCLMALNSLNNTK